MKDGQKLYVYETPKSIVTSWVVPDHLMAANFRWLGNVYYHPEVEIFLGKSTTVHRRNFFRLDQAVMHALADANISVKALRRPAKARRKPRRPTIGKHKQERLF